MIKQVLPPDKSAFDRGRYQLMLVKGGGHMGKNNNSKDLGKHRGKTLDEHDKNTNLRQSNHNDRNKP